MKEMFKNLFNTETIKVIITHLEQQRKGALLIILIGSIGFLIMEYFLIKIGMFGNFFVQFYALCAFVSGGLLLVKIYNEICEQKEDEEEEKQQQEEYRLKVQRFYPLMKQVFDCLTSEELKFLKRFVDENTLSIVDATLDRGINHANFITSKIYSFRFNIQIGGNGFINVFTINKMFYDLLCMYFTQNKYFSEGLNK